MFKGLRAIEILLLAIVLSFTAFEMAEVVGLYLTSVGEEIGEELNAK